MNKFAEKLKEFRKSNGISDGKAIEMMGIDKETLVGLEDGTIRPTKSEIKLYCEKLGMKYMSLGNKINKGLDLIFRLGSCIIAIMTLLLCINQNIDHKTLIVLLSISLVCNSMILLPKIDK